MKVVAIKANKNNYLDAVEKAKALLLKDGDVEVTLNFARGRYNFTEENVFDLDGKKGKKKLRVLGAGKKNTIFSSVSTLLEKDFISCGELSYVQFSKDENGNYPRIGSLYKGDVKVPIAKSKRYRISPYFMDANGNFAKWGYGHHDEWENRHKFYLALESVKELGLEEKCNVELQVFVEWEFKICHAVGVDLNDKIVDEKGKTFVAVLINPEEKVMGHNKLTFANRPMYVCNSIANLKENGGYVYNKREGKLYVRTKDLDFSKTYSIGKASRIFVLNGLESVEFEGITFTKTNDFIKDKFDYWCSGQAGASAMSAQLGLKGEFVPYSAIYATKLNGLTVKDCIFKMLPCGAISGNYSLKNVNIIDNDFIDLGASAVRLGSPVPADVTNEEDNYYLENVKIINNYINVTGAYYNENCAITVTRVKGLRIQYNTILNSGYSAISVGWRWLCPDYDYGERVNVIDADISHNYIKTFMIYTSDGGAIYMLGGNAKHENDAIMNYVHENYIVETPKTALQRRFFSCLYHDGSCTSWYNGNNVIVHHPDKHNIYSSRVFIQYWSPTKESFNIANEEGQNCWNIFIKNNHYIGCRDIFDVYHRYLAHVMEDNTRNIRESDRHFYKDLNEAIINPVVKGVIDNAGAKR